MKYIFDHLENIQKNLNWPLIAFFDFDMTLASLERNPKNASLPLSTRRLLTELSKEIPIGIISGRALDDIVSRVDIPHIMYAGNHGIEWSARGQKYTSPNSVEDLIDPREKLLALSALYPQSTFVEDKYHTIAFHYRMADKDAIAPIEKALHDLAIDNVSIRWSKMTFEVRPKWNWNKGSVCLSMIQLTQTESSIPIYIGDDLTDEDAFLSLSHGLTIRVGKSTKSKAQYYLREQKEIDALLEYLLVSLQRTTRRLWEVE